jgi:hypothetical protein
MTKTYRLVLAAATLALWCFATRSASAQAAFAIALIPDTQNYSEFSSYSVYQHQMQWLVNNRSARNIKFAVHLGDITNHDTASEYDVASAAHTLLDNAGMAYSMTIGNHDIYPSNQAYKRESLYANYFGEARYAGEAFYGGAYDASNVNNFTFFTQRAANTNTAGQHTRPSIGMASNGNFVLAWEDDQDENGSYQIFARGLILGAEF